MKLSDKDLNLFVVFDVIYTEKNLTKAGEVLGITQPAVSNALSRLRDEFSDELFIRTSTGMKPTPVAENMISDIKEALKLIRNSISESETFDPKTAKATFRISIGDTSEYRLLPELIKNITLSAPEIDVQSFLTPRSETPKELAAGNIDFAIDPPIHSAPNLRHKKIYEDNYVLVVNKKHPIAKKASISLDDYLDLSHIHISKRPIGLGHVDATLNRLGINRRIAVRAQHFLVAPHIIEQSNLAMTTIKSFSRGRDFKVFKLPFKINPLVLHLYWHANKDQDPSNEWMRKMILKTYGKIQGKK
ncbi:MAG: LysR family transcriptional regulator [Gammaproteobacteria bacterium]|nr:LysR family transcriptional regulator [Gammaproteobacteria bacterium]|tara:strand:- start:13562 stop:14470 length:909 start_codon:yes stop_codon:yes gene_type:complete